LSKKSRFSLRDRQAGDAEDAAAPAMHGRCTMIRTRPPQGRIPAQQDFPRPSAKIWTSNPSNLNARRTVLLQVNAVQQGPQRFKNEAPGCAGPLKQ